MSRDIFRNAKLFDGWTEVDSDRVHVLVEDGFIKEISDRALSESDAEVVNCRGRTLMQIMPAIGERSL